MRQIVSENDPHPDRRRFPRLAAPLYARPARLRLVDKKQQVLDASLGGIRIYSDDAHKQDSTLELDLFLKDGTSITCNARVAWIKKLPDKRLAHYEVGLAFIDLSDAGREKLQTVLVPEDEGGPNSP
jgi:c-di-GMP-binding flagellar brake protein YcgR